MSETSNDNRSMRPQPGSSLKLDDVIGRDDAVAKAIEQMRQGRNLLLSDPRRMGKTHLLRLLVSKLNGDDAAVLVDYEGVTTVDEFLIRTAAALGSLKDSPKQDKVRSVLKTIFEGSTFAAGPVKISPAFARESPAELLRRIVDQIDRDFGDNANGGILVIAMDELPLAMRNIVEHQGASAANTLFQTLRQLRVAPNSSLRWILSGSIGFHHVLRRAGVTEGAINDLSNLPLGPLSASDAGALAEALLRGIGRKFEPDAVAAIREWTDGIPFLIHQLANILESKVGLNTAVTRVQVQEAFDSFLDDRDESRAVTHLVTRLDDNYGADIELAQCVLDAVETKGDQTISDLRTLLNSQATAEAVNSILDMLVDDHYLAEAGGKFRWRYPILQTIWLRRRRLTQ